MVTKQLTDYTRGVIERRAMGRRGGGSVERSDLVPSNYTHPLANEKGL